MIRFLMGFCLYKQGNYRPAIASHQIAREVVENKLETIARSRRSENNEDHSQLQAQENDLVKLQVKLYASMAKCHMKLKESVQALANIDQGKAFLRLKKGAEFLEYYLEKKQAKVLAFF